MNRQLQSSKLALAFTLSLGTLMTLTFSNLSLAQTPRSITEPDTHQINERSTTTGSSTFGNSFNPINLIHNMNLRRSRDGSEFQDDTQNNLNNAAEEFKRMQQEQLQQNGGDLAPNSTPSN